MYAVKKLLLLISMLIASLTAHALPGGDSLPSWEQLDGSMMPLSPERFMHAPSLPDSLNPVMLNHVGRHGARFLTSASTTSGLMLRIAKARREGRLTERGEEFAGVIALMDSLTAHRWGALDSLGFAQQTAIGGWLEKMMPAGSGSVAAVSSYVPRVVMSMYGCLHSIEGANPRLETEASAGHRFDSFSLLHY